MQSSCWGGGGEIKKYEAVTIVFVINTKYPSPHEKTEFRDEGWQCLFPRDTFWSARDICSKFWQNGSKCPWQFWPQKMPVTIFFCPWQKWQIFARDTKKCPWQKSKILPVTKKNYPWHFWDQFFFPAPSARPFFLLRFCQNYFFARENFLKCPWHFFKSRQLPVKRARDIFEKNCPWHFTYARDTGQKSAGDMPKCPWQFSKNGNVTGKKMSRGKKTLVLNTCSLQYFLA